MIEAKYSLKETKFLNNLQEFRQQRLKQFVDKYKGKLKNWEVRLKIKVNDQLPKKFWHRKRPNKNRPFPYKNTGALKKSIKTKIKVLANNKQLVKIHSWAEISSPHAYYTNLGLRRRKNGEEVGWKEWVDDVLYNEGRDGLISVSDIFKEMTYDTLIF